MLYSLLLPRASFALSGWRHARTVHNPEYLRSLEVSRHHLALLHAIRVLQATVDEGKKVAGGLRLRRPARVGQGAPRMLT